MQILTKNLNVENIDLIKIRLDPKIYFRNFVEGIYNILDLGNIKFDIDLFAKSSFCCLNSQLFRQLNCDYYKVMRLI